MSTLVNQSATKRGVSRFKGENRQIIANLAKNNDIDEIAILTWCHSEKARIQSYELFADEFKLNAKKSLQKTC